MTVVILQIKVSVVEREWTHGRFIKFPDRLVRLCKRTDVPHLPAPMIKKPGKQ